jgi:hypothetical protein
VDVSQNFGWGWGWNPYWGVGFSNVTTTPVGSLFIDIIDAKTKELIWQGEGSGYLTKNTEKKSVTCMYFSAERAPYNKSLIALNANPERLVNNLAVMSNVSSDYAPEGKSLISISLAEDQQFTKSELLEMNVKDEMKFWYPDCLGWEHLKTYALLATWVEKYVAFVLPETKAKISLKFTTLNIWICGLLMRLFSCIFPM